MKTLAEHAVDVLNDPEFHTPTWKLNAGHLDALHEIYDRYTIERGLPVNNGRHPRAVLRSVTNALANTKSGQERFRVTGTINYPGIINAPCNVFELREPFRAYAPPTEEDLPTNLDVAESSRDGQRSDALQSALAWPHAKEKRFG